MPDNLMVKINIADIRQEYTKGGLRENELPGDLLSGFYFADREPGILQKGSGSASVGRNDNCQFVRAFQFTDIEVLWKLSPFH